MIILCTICACENSEPLPIIDIQIDSFSQIKKEACQIQYTDSNGDLFDLPARIRHRGGMSIKYKKKSFSLELDQGFPLARLPLDDDWILNANYIDKTFMRHKVSYDLFRQMNSQNLASICRYITVKINGNDQGLYVLMQKLNASIIGLNKNDPMAMLFKDPPVFKKLDKSKIVSQEVNSFYQQKYPKVKKVDHTKYLDSLRQFLFKSSDVDFNKNVFNWFDESNIIDWHLILLLTNNNDGILKNFYLFKRDTKSTFQIALWDYDHSFGRDGDNELNLLARELDIERSILFDRLLNAKNSTYENKLKSRWSSLRKNAVFSKANILDLIKENQLTIKDQIENNFSIWPVDGDWYFDDQNYDQEIELIKTYLDLRFKQLDKHFDYAN